MLLATVSRLRLSAARLRHFSQDACIARAAQVDSSCFSHPVQPVEHLAWLKDEEGYGQSQFLHSNPQLRIAYFMELADHRPGLGRRMLARAWFGRCAAGPPGHVHGGALAALLDEIMGGCAWQNGYSVVAGEISVRFEKSVPLGTDVMASACIESIEGRKLFVRGEIYSASAKYALGSGTFIDVADRLSHWDELK